ncbi:MAG: M48 family metalloprotease [Woeseiaceae bacterium]|nr:M48 family metalloprotease [Woeseiaceae bacterium]
MTNTRDTMHFRVVFNGRLIEGKTLAEVREAFTEKFGEKIARSVFARSNVVLKKGLEREQAEKFQRLFGSLGMETSLEEELPAGFQLSLEDEPKQQAMGAQAAAQPAADSPSEKGVIQGRGKAKAAPRNETYTLQQIRSAFKGTVDLPDPPAGYTSRLVGVAIMMLMLPLAYVGIALLSVVLTLWIVFGGRAWYFSVFDPGYVSIFLYAAILIGSLMLTAFLFKPLIARAPKGPEPVRVDPSREPVLFCLVGEITDAIGAPAPDEILLDTEVNASAKLTRGPLSNELTLTIGLPLIWGADVNTLAGILAHEFGHFTQKWGMRAYYVTHWINYWFYRQIHGRDRWDLFVDEMMRRDAPVLGLAAIFASLGSALCRVIMSGLSYLASVISFSYSRQAEFDADRYQTGLLGSDRYEKTAERITLLGAAYQVTLSDLDMAMDAGRKVNNLPRMVALRADGFSADEIKRITASIEEVNTSIFDTHPTDQERIRQARDAGMRAKFELQGSARGLLRDLERLSQVATLQWYRSFGIAATADELLPIEEFESETDALTHASESIEKYFGVLGDYPLHVELPAAKLVAKVATEKLVAGLVGLNEKLRTSRNELAGRRDRLRLNTEYQWSYRHAQFWRKAGLEIDLSAYQVRLETADPDEIAGKLAGLRQSEGELLRDLRAGAELLGKKLAVAMELARRDDPELVDEIDRLRAAYITVGHTFDEEKSLTESCVNMEMLMEGCGMLPDMPEFPRRLKQETDRNERIQNRIREILSRTRDPSKPGLTLADALPDRVEPGDREPPEVLQDAGSVVRQVGRLGFRILGQMAEIALAAEQQHRIR